METNLRALHALQTHTLTARLILAETASEPSSPTVKTKKSANHALQANILTARLILV